MVHAVIIARYGPQSEQFPRRGTPDLEHAATSSQEY